MRKPGLMLLCIAMLALTATGIAQDDQITVSSSVSPNQIKAWLEGSDSRLTAWGAYFASRSEDANNDDAYVTIMARRMARWNPPGMATSPAGWSMSEILYALIEKNERVPLVSLTPIRSDFPIQALILATRLSPEDAALLLQPWYEGRIPPKESRQSGTPFAYVAGMLLAKAPPSGFAASILAESRARVSFWVASGMYQQSKWTGGVGPPACHDEDQVIEPPHIVAEEVPRWPPLFQYLLQDDASPYEGKLLVDVGGERVSYRRLSARIRPARCYFPDVSSEEATHHVVAALLGVRDQEMPWPTHQDVICIEECKAGFLSALKKQIGLEESKLIATVEALRAKGYLTHSEADAVRPELSVLVNDARETFYGEAHEPPPLPRFAPRDPRISISYDKR